MFWDIWRPRGASYSRLGLIHNLMQISSPTAHQLRQSHARWPINMRINECHFMLFCYTVVRMTIGEKYTSIVCSINILWFYDLFCIMLINHLFILKRYKVCTWVIGWFLGNFQFFVSHVFFCFCYHSIGLIEWFNINKPSSLTSTC